jgi:hypothetical protein
MLALPICSQTVTADNLIGFSLPASVFGRLMQVVDGEVFIVPDERSPTDKNGKEQWPPGWHPGRRVESERDIFELLSLPYREPHERNAP